TLPLALIFFLLLLRRQPPSTLFPYTTLFRSIAYNISAGGIGITLPCPLRDDSLLDVEAWNLPGAPRLRARVVHARFFDFLWFCRSEEHTSELQSLRHLVCRLLLEKKNKHNKD